MISVVICSKDPLKSPAIEKHYESLLAGHEHEIIIIRDARSICEGYNRGFARSRGDFVVFSHDDVEFLTPDFAPRMLDHLARFDGVGVAGTDQLVGPSWIMAGPPHIFGQVGHKHPNYIEVCLYGPEKKGGVQAIDGLFMAFRRGVVEKIGWDSDTFPGFHHYDMDFAYRAHLAGYNLAIVHDLPVLHASIGSFDATWQASSQVFMHKHRIVPLPQRRFQFAAVLVATQAEALAMLDAVARLYKPA